MIRGLPAAVGFLTRVPVGRAGAELRHAAAWFPLVGLALGGAAAGFCWLARGHVPSFALAALAVGLVALLSGGLHLDGLADSFDALGGGRGNRARQLEIMRDPRSGPHGVAAIVLVQLAVVGCVAPLLPERLWLVALWPAAARAAAVPALAWLPAARPDGLGASLRAATSAADVAVALALAAGACLLAGPQSRAALAGLAAAGAVAALWSLWWRRRLGGCTGDTHGAAIELAGLAFLLVAAA